MVYKIVLIIISVALIVCVHSFPYGSSSTGSSSRDTVVVPPTRSDVTGFDLSRNTRHNNVEEAITNLFIKSDSPSYGAAYNTENKVIEVRRVSQNDVASNNYNNQNSDNSKISTVTGRGSSINEDDGTKSSKSQQHPQGNSNINAVTGLDQDAIIFPDSLSKLAPRDSYGNPVTPYSVLPDEQYQNKQDTQIVELGHRTDVNKDPGFVGTIQSESSSNSNKNKDNLGFVVPSYASGILETLPDKSLNIPKPQTSLLPPETSSNFNFPSRNEEQSPKTDSSSQQIAFTNQSKNPNKNGEQVVIPSDLILPPFEASNTQYRPADNSQAIKPISSGSSKDSSFGSQLTQNAQQSSTYNRPSSTNTQNSNQSSQKNPIQANIPSNLVSNKPQSAYTQPIAPSPTQPTTSTTKYTGSFGGAPGVLSAFDKPSQSTNQLQSRPQLNNQQSQYNSNPQQQQQQTQNSFNRPQSGSTPQIQEPIRNPQSSYTSQNTQQSVNRPQTGLVPPNSNSQSSYSTQNIPSRIQTQNSNPTNNVSSNKQSQTKYTGGFGGPPGILLPYDNVKSSQTKSN